MKTNRNPSIELYRISLMFGIVLLHSIEQLGYKDMWLAHMLQPCVVGFVFISGYFGIKFKWRKIADLIALAIACRILAMLIFPLFVDAAVSPFTPILRNGILRTYWFLWAYIALMCFAPLVDHAINTIKGKKAILGVFIPLLVMIWGWGYATSLPVIGRYLPVLTGAGCYTWLGLLATYIGARLCFALNVESLLSKCMLLIGLIALLGITAFGFGHYDSPFAFLLAMVGFYLFKKVKIRGGAGLLYVAPSMFAIYLLHTGPGIGFSFMYKIELMSLSCIDSIYVAYLACAVITFCFCLAIDLIRRQIALFFVSLKGKLNG